MERFRVPSRTLFLASLGASVLAGAGVETLLEPRVDARVWRRAAEAVLRAGLVAADSSRLVGRVALRGEPENAASRRHARSAV